MKEVSGNVNVLCGGCRERRVEYAKTNITGPRELVQMARGPALMATIYITTPRNKREKNMYVQPRRNPSTQPDDCDCISPTCASQLHLDSPTVPPQIEGRASHRKTYHNSIRSVGERYDRDRGSTGCPRQHG